MRKSFLIRISPDLFDDLNEWAKDEFRSLNGQIEWILNQAVMKRKKINKPNAENQNEEPPEGG